MINKANVSALGYVIRSACQESGKFEDCLRGACGLASYMLHTKLSELGIKSKFVKGSYDIEPNFSGSHCWVEVGCMIIDITATQFADEIPAVYITSISNKKYHANVKKFDAKDFFSWPDYQNPEHYQYIWENNKLKLWRKEDDS